MKRQIRQGVFETNSSSVHTIAIKSGSQIAENIDSYRGETLYFGLGDYGWERETYDTIESRAAYLNSSLESTYHTELREQISEVLMRYGIECEFKTNDDGGFYCIDHGSELADFVTEIANDENLLLDYLFGDAYVETGNDNGDYTMPNDPSHEYDYIYEKGN